MANLLSRLTNLITELTRKRSAPRNEGAALPVFKHAWKLLLSANSRFLTQVLLSRRALQGDSFLTMVFVRSQCTDMCVAVFAMLRHLREMTDRNISFLERPCQELQSSINTEIAPNLPLPACELTLPLSRVNASLSPVAGTKMAFLGEIKQLFKDVLIPEGFVITAAAYHLFLDHHGLRDEINRRLQTLEVKTLVDMFRISSELQLLIINAPLPSKLEDAIRAAYRELEASVGHRGVRVVLRSSVAGEDSLETSFAGQSRTELNVSEELLFMAYKEVLASKYSLTSMNYRLSRGLKDEDLPMCVGCLAMVETTASGVMLTRHPALPESPDIHVNAVHGLAKAITDGYVTPDSWVVTRSPEPRISSTDIREKPERFVSFLSEEGVTLLDTPTSQLGKPSLNDEQVLLLCRIGIELENHFGLPLDIEWSVSKEGQLHFHQARPITPVNVFATPQISTKDQSATRLLYSGGHPASPGIASGEVFIAHNNNDLLHFPDGAVLVTSRPHPSWSALVPRATAVVTEKGGGAFSHLANVAREFSVPALFDVPNATSFLQKGQYITVNTLEPRIKEAFREKAAPSQSNSFVSLIHTPVHDTLAAVMANVDRLTSITPLARRNPEESIQSLRDVAHGCLLLSCSEILTLARVPDMLRPLAVAHPANWWVLDLDAPPLESSDLSGRPPALVLPEMHPLMHAIWEGIASMDWRHYVNSPYRNPALRYLRRLRSAIRPLTAPRPRIFVVCDQTTHLYLLLERAQFIIQVQTGQTGANSSISFLWQWFGRNNPASSDMESFTTRLQAMELSVDLKADGLFAWTAGPFNDDDLTAMARFFGSFIGFVQSPATTLKLPPTEDAPSRAPHP